MKIVEAIQRVQSPYSRGMQSKDSRLTPRHIYSCLITARSTLIRQQSNKSQKINQWIYQVLPCVEMIPAPMHECVACLPSECKTLRTKYKLPRLVSDVDKTLLKSITSLDGELRFDMSEFENLKYGKGNKFTADKPSMYLRNGYGFVAVYKMIEILTMEGIFEDPLEVYEFPSSCPCTDCECQDIMELEFPIDRDLLRPLIQIAQEELIVMFKQMKSDEDNNAQDDTGTGMVHQPQAQG